MAKETYSEFTFTWSVHNFSHCALKQGEYLMSPKFKVEFLREQFHLKLYPRGDYDTSDFISCFLCREKNKSNFGFAFTLSILKPNGLLNDSFPSYDFPNGWSKFGLDRFLNFQTLQKNEASYLDNDTLTIRCLLWWKEHDPISVMCFAHTKIKVCKLLYTWTLNNMNAKVMNKYMSDICESVDIPSVSSMIPCLSIQLLNRVDFDFDDNTIYIAIDISSADNDFLLVYVVHLLDADGSVAQSVSGKHLFNKSTTNQSTDFPFLSKRKLLSNEKQYLPNEKLTLQCEFYISSNNPEIVVETVECREKTDLKMKPTPGNQISEENDLLKTNMHKLFTEGEFSDFVVSAPTQQFPVHRAILCTQSEVFTAMLKHNMKEKNSNVVEIEDLEDDIVSKMLLYLYTNTLDEIDVPTAQKLYYAADKYRIKTLQKSCSNYLMRNIDVSNVTEILVLADTHQDQDLKSGTSAFILEHVFEVINSEKWKNIMATHGHLTSEIMQEIICKKLFDTKFAL